MRPASHELRLPSRRDDVTLKWEDDAADAIARVTAMREAPDLILFDRLLARGAEGELIDRIRSRARLHDVPIVLYTVNGSDSAEASPLEDVIHHQRDETELDQTRAAIIRLMAEGEKDEAISRRLSISVRTCRRHIADYMVQVGATSRFQAGVIAARAGHTDSPLPG